MLSEAFSPSRIGWPRNTEAGSETPFVAYREERFGRSPNQKCIRCVQQVTYLSGRNLLEHHRQQAGWPGSDSRVCTSQPVCVQGTEILRASVSVVRIKSGSTYKIPASQQLLNKWQLLLGLTLTKLSRWKITFHSWSKIGN